ncbi:transposase [Saccharopolyspora sp. K220]|uniref:NF041680 family putative transposase n=1 Tax=Saccharopolyspora soli TaxID=2926618 RepID=UPI001F58020D|nr:NF041680 family putative transposase [Saccharopolyspora soli]MCI2422693.1 transposase [Saccharopolyspora soli]
MHDADRVNGCGELSGFRREFYRCLVTRSDALFELADAVLCAEGPVSSLVRLCLEPEFRRGHGSLYEALARRRIDEDALRAVLAAHRPADWPLVFAVDASTVERCDAETSPQRGFYYHPSKHSAGQPIVAGWSYQWICQLNHAANSWTAPMDAQRIRPGQSTVAVTVTQIRTLLGRLQDTGGFPVFVFDAGYDPIALSWELRGDRAQVLVRIKNDRVFHGPAPAVRADGKPGRPPRHGQRFACKDPATWGTPDQQLTITDNRYGQVRVRGWSRLHPKLGCRGHWAGMHRPPIVEGTVIRVDVQRLPKPSTRTNATTLWLWHSGPHTPDLDLVWRAYLRRFDIEHTLRFAKNTLGWTTPGVRLPEQADRWTWLIVVALTQLRLARTLVTDQRLPWEKPREPHTLTPTRIRRGFRRTHTHLPVITRPPKPSRPGPGRPPGSSTGPAPRHPAIKTTQQKP